MCGVRTVFASRLMMYCVHTRALYSGGSVRAARGHSCAVSIRRACDACGDDQCRAHREDVAGASTRFVYHRNHAAGQIPDRTYHHSTLYRLLLMIQAYPSCRWIGYEPLLRHPNLQHYRMSASTFPQASAVPFLPPRIMWLVVLGLGVVSPHQLNQSWPVGFTRQMSRISPPMRLC